MADLTVSADVDAMMASANNAAIISNIGAASLSGNQTFTGDQIFSGQVDITGDLTVDTTTLHVDSANNRVGIGTASPVQPLEVSGNIQSRDVSGSNIGIRGINGGTTLYSLTRQDSIANTGDCAIGAFGGIGFKAGEGLPTSFHVYINSSGQLTFPANSGTWNGATITGAQSFSGQVELTGQAASTDDSAMTRSLVDARTGSKVAYNFSTNTVTSSTTLADVCAITLPVGQYKVKLFWNLQGTANTGTRHGFTFTGTTSFRGNRLRGSSLTAVQITTASLNLGLAETATTAWVEGIMDVTVSGDLKLQFAQNTSHTDNTTADGTCYIEVTPLVDLQAD